MLKRNTNSTGNNTAAMTRIPSPNVIVNIDATTRSIFEGCDDCDWTLVPSLVHLARITSTLSSLGSVHAVFSLPWTSKRRRENFKSTFNRILLLLCAFDILSSTEFFIGDWAMPASPPQDGYYYIERSEQPHQSSSLHVIDQLY